MKHRPDIDGLRSLAIIPVVAYHVGSPAVPGGFAGVDVFFVISGFLITMIIRDELLAGSFSLLEFYKRRALRIVPALFVMIAATYAVAYATMLPVQFEDFGASVVAAGLFFSNIYFWQQTDYFAGSSEFLPLLHTWSLAVEEQFYLIFPLVMMAVAWFFRARFAPVLLALVLASFAVCLWGTANEPSATFYLLPTRAWELGIGALVATAHIPKLPRWMAEMASLLGVALIGYAVFMLDTSMDFPGYNALFPCLGAALLIAYARDTRVGALLSTSPFVGVGKISYSLYLWHWPVIVFYRLEFHAQPDRVHMFEMVVFSIALAIASYVFIEAPFRDKRLRIAPPRQILPWGAAALLTIGGLGFETWRSGNGWRSVPPDVQTIASFLDYTSLSAYETQFRPGRCMINQADGSFDAFDINHCLALETDRPNFLVVGDSHAGHLWRAVQMEHPEINVLQATSSGCRPTLEAKGHPRCTDMMSYVFDEFLPNERLDGVILAARWKPEDMRKIGDTVSYLDDVTDRVIVMGPTVEYVGELPFLLAKSRLSGNDSLIAAAIDPTRKELSDEMAYRLADLDAQYYPVYDYLCRGRTCLAETQGGEPMQFDYGHFTLSGSIELVRLMKADARLPLKLGE
ncbi:MAG: acyltransferase family protein [Pseudomonadota bacterium]